MFWDRDLPPIVAGNVSRNTREVPPALSRQCRVILTMPSRELVGGFRSVAMACTRTPESDRQKRSYAQADRRGHVGRIGSASKCPVQANSKCSIHSVRLAVECRHSRGPNSGTQ
ncbi:hypothetical protein BaRGS_00002178 [Batillaria attramentaria]|uniref:Uncharacterized protein n=1 Tax=Batillaria attramentaria TaxID=370345 RepID=A0ABD0M694_9CAEN